MTWLALPEQWTRLGQRLQTAGEFGLDTETYGQPDKTSPQHRARVHCWSVGVLTSKRHPRGYQVATGFVLPVEALYNSELRAVLGNGAVRKWAHNAPHDYHSIVNMGVEVRGLEDTLQWSRVAVPGMTAYNLKAMSQWALGKAPRPTFKDVTAYETMALRSTFRKEKRCNCGKKPCRAKGSSEWFDPAIGWWRHHERTEERIETVHSKMVTMHYEVPQFVPGAQLEPLVWQGKSVDRMVAWELYSLEDALDGIELVSWLRSRPPRIIPSPWSE